MNTIEMKIPDFLENDVRSFVAERIRDYKEELEKKLKEVNVFFNPVGVPQEIPFDKEETKLYIEPPVENKKIVIKKKRVQKGPKRTNLLNSITEVVAKAHQPLTTHEIAGALRDKYVVKTKKEYNSLTSSVSAMLAQYHLKYDHRFDRTRDDNNNFIYTCSGKNMITKSPMAQA